MPLRAFLSVFWLYFFSWPHIAALKTILTTDELATIESSAKVYALLLIGTKDIAQDKSLEDLAISAYPTLPGIEKELEGIVTFGVVDISKHLKDAIGKKWQHTKLPALTLFQDPPKENPYTGKLYRDSTIIDAGILDNPRKLKKILKQSIPTEFVQNLEGDEATLTSFERRVQQIVEDGKTVILLVSKQKDASPMFRALAAEFHDQGLSFVFLNKNQEGAEEIIKKLKVVDLPAFMAIRSMTEHVVLSPENTKTYKELKGFVEPFVLQDGGEARKDGKKEKDTSKIVRFFREDEFDELVLDSGVVWIIDFMDSGRMQALDGEKWKNMLANLHQKVGMVGMGAVNCEQEAELCQRYGGPGVRIFPLRLTEDKTPKRDDVFPETFASIDDAKKAAVAFMPDLSVEIASSIELKAFISKAQETHALPLLFFTPKKTTPPMIKALLLSIPTQKLMLAVIHDAAEDLKKQFLAGSSASTSLICLVPTQANRQEPASPPFGVIAYNKKAMGSYTYPNILRFVLKVLAQYPHPQDSKLEQNEVDSVSLDASAQALVPYVTKQNFDDMCGGNKICVIGFFEHHSDTLHDPESRLAKEWTTLVHVATRSKQNQEPFSFMWVNGNCQKDFAEAFGIGLFQMPTVAVYSPSKQRYATNLGLFDEENVAGFLKSVLSGSISTSPIGNVPVLREECALDASQETAAGVDDVAEDDEDLKEMLSEILSEEKKQRDELEKDVKKLEKKSKKKQKSKKKKSKKKKAARDEL